MIEYGICGHFGKGGNFSDGQTIKTKTFTETLEKKVGKENVCSIDTNGWKRNPFGLLSKCIMLFKSNQKIIMLPGKNGLTLFAPLFLNLNKMYKRKLYYVVIGGWLPEFLKEKSKLAEGLQKLDGIFVETKKMKEKLEDLNFTNVIVLPNFKKINIISTEAFLPSTSKPLKLCTFSRVMKEKGIEEAIQAVKTINEKYDEPVFTLDIYGQIDQSYKEDFKKTISASPSYIKYKGIIQHNESVNILKNYYMMLFPTYYNGEGFAGTILDAFSSGLPVIATNWRYNNEIIEAGRTGTLVPIKNTDAIVECLVYYKKNEEKVKMMRSNCIEEAKKYSPEKSIEIFLESLK